MGTDDTEDPGDSGMRPARAIRERLLPADGAVAMPARGPYPEEVPPPALVMPSSPEPEPPEPPTPPPPPEPELVPQQAPQPQPQVTQALHAGRDVWSRAALEMGETLTSEKQARSFRVIGFIGRGGMGEVYEVEEEGVGDRFALKCMRLSDIKDPERVHRARMEAYLLERLRHPNVVPVYCTGVRDDGLIWMVMRLLRGWTLAQILKEHGPVPIPWALSMIRDVCKGLVAIHSFQVIHRDIKPENVLLDRDGHVWVLDLGAARFTEHGLMTTGGFILGTLTYMSPEQLVKPDDVDRRSDLFAVGVTLYELLSGRHPFVERAKTVDTRAIGGAILYTAPRPLRQVAPKVPAYLEEVVMTLLAKEPRDRYQDAGDAWRMVSAARGGPGDPGVWRAAPRCEGRAAGGGARGGARGADLRSGEERRLRQVRVLPGVLRGAERGGRGGGPIGRDPRDARGGVTEAGGGGGDEARGAGHGGGARAVGVQGAGAAGGAREAVDARAAGGGVGGQHRRGRGAGGEGECDDGAAGDRWPEPGGSGAVGAALPRRDERAGDGAGAGGGSRGAEGAAGSGGAAGAAAAAAIRSATRTRRWSQAR